VQHTPHSLPLVAADREPHEPEQGGDSFDRVHPMHTCARLSLPEPRRGVSYAGAVSDKEREKVRRTLLRHAEAGRLAVDKAVAALKTLDPQDFPPYMVPKLLETGAAVSVAAFAALRELDAEERPAEDPWSAIAAELDPANWTAADVAAGDRDRASHTHGY
jgi:hypothetical protein